MQSVINSIPSGVVFNQTNVLIPSQSANDKRTVSAALYHELLNSRLENA